MYLIGLTDIFLMYIKRGGYGETEIMQQYIFTPVIYKVLKIQKLM